MPSHILGGPLPEPPAWGTLPLDVYLLEQRDAPLRTSNPPISTDEAALLPLESETLAERSKRLIRQFLALGQDGRQPCWTRALDNTTQPTSEQIEQTLRPARPESLRPYAYYSHPENGMWWRLCYDADEEKEHAALWEENTYATFVNDEGFLLDDKELFADLTITQALELFPERVTNAVRWNHREWRKKILAECLEDLEDCNPTEALKPEQYGDYHAACVVTHIFVEDRQALETGDLLHVFLDDCGNVVREWRTEEGADDEFDGGWFERGWKEDISGGRAELGLDYQRGGSRGPPYTRGST